MSGKNLKIYFGRSIRGGQKGEDARVFSMLVKELMKYGKVLTEKFGDDQAIQKEDAVTSDKAIYQADLTLIDQSDVMVAEVSNPSLGVGYEIGRAHDGNKKILCLYRPKDAPKKLSAMIRGADGINNLTVRDYEESAIPSILSDYFG
ncbi:putative 2'-deoxynucleoside 5'-phosphate N-hydrolase 1 [Strongylocentrotus purpuratus]|uniref:Putative 2'-deoxynucleoside 5'-phosphate N-hydrolase 1 n=1 Tax=Strongylocentrotus purpuratus TaxID=7668 RepID=A0A7M7HKU4_STRPU|nr:putative 2'-deoxynucleoside 5'-phosphate N-hydrolase 1 [Strongylocentrotus purpuratus]|eukprot:XP_011673792.1 PREDICTED: putative 2'-deoxynucleoside 5'-phosphate N-hydrolase 1 [Strongylocentrotus purpuratus]